MSDTIKLHYTVCAEDFTRAGEASSDVKKRLKQMGCAPEIVRKVAIAMYEGEINMVIHANGGVIDVEISPEEIVMVWLAGWEDSTIRSILNVMKKIKTAENKSVARFCK